MRSIAALLLVLVSNFTPSPTQSVEYTIRPPARFRADGLFAIATVGNNQISETCKANGGAAYDFACEKNGIGYVPNPCEYPSDGFAKLMCHEIAHIQGWPGDHPK